MEFFLLVGAVALWQRNDGKAATMDRLLALARTGNDDLDRDLVRGNIVRAAVAVFGAARLEAQPQLLRALMAIASNEQPPGGWPAFGPFIGDGMFSGGPSVGILQVYRNTAKSEGLWVPSDAAAGDDAAEQAEYAQLSDFTALPQTTLWGVQIFAVELHRASGDVADAIRRFNGGGAAAAAYRDRALQFASRTWNEDFA